MRRILCSTPLPAKKVRRIEYSTYLPAKKVRRIECSEVPIPTIGGRRQPAMAMVPVVVAAPPARLLPIVSRPPNMQLLCSCCDNCYA
jgi:hypothetical protein